MDLRRIRHFIVLAETLNFHKAAERLHIAQPALSVSIQKLEAELGAKLFLRAPSGISLTQSGCAALVEAKRLMFHGTQISQAARSASDGTGGTLHIGFVGSATYGMLQRLVPRFRSEHPGVELVLRESTSARISQLIDEDSLDIGIVRIPLVQNSKAGLVQLEQERFVAALPRGNPLCGRPLLDLGDLADESFIMYGQPEANGLRSAAMQACQKAGFLPRITQEALQISTLLALVESALGIALVPSVMQRFVSERIVYRTLPSLDSSSSTGLALLYRKEGETAAAQRFRLMAKKEYPPSDMSQQL